jgi:hypothetical protein
VTNFVTTNIKMPREYSKYKWEIIAIKQLQPGHAIKFLLKKPWGFASYLYKNKVKSADIKLRLGPNFLLAYRMPEIMEWKVRE